MSDLDLIESRLNELARVMASLRKSTNYYQGRNRYAREKYGLPAAKLLRSRKVRKRKAARARERLCKKPEE